MGSRILQVALIVAAGSCCLAWPACAGAADWPQFGYDAAHTSYNPGESTIDSSNVGSLVQTWKFSTGVGNAAYNVVEANGVVYAASQNGTLFAINAATGSQVWTASMGSGLSPATTTPAVSAGLIFSPCTLTAGERGICALNSTTGASVWSYPLSGSYSFAGAVTALSNRVYFEGCTALDECDYYALRQTSGHVVWTFTEAGGCAANGGLPPAIAQDELLAAAGCTTRPVIIGIESTYGRGYWALGEVGMLEGTSIANGVGYYTEWTPETGAWTVTAVRVLHPSGPLWMKEGPATDAGFQVQSALVGGEAYLSLGGTIQVHHAKKEREMWKTGQNSAQVAIASDLLFTVWNGAPSATYAAQNPHGALLWSASGSDVVGSPIIANGMVYGACDGSNICGWGLPGASRLRSRRILH